MKSSKQVGETAAGKSISAYVVLKRHRPIATIQAHFADSGGVLVNVFNFGKNKDAEKLPFQAGRAGGYGYDKFTAALTGLSIDGHKLGNHCQFSKEPPAGGVWPSDAIAPRGWHFANWKSQEWVGDERKDLPADKQGYSSCYRESGLKYLEAMGYTVFRAI